MKRKRSSLSAVLLLVGLAGSGILWLKAERRQYALNRQLIAAVVYRNDPQALMLLDKGADPNAQYYPPPALSLPALLKQFFYSSPRSVTRKLNPTALSMVCGASAITTYIGQSNVPDDAPLVRAMLTHGAMVNVKDEDGRTPLLWAIANRRPHTVCVLLEYGADPNAKEHGDWPALLNTVSADAYGLDIVRLLLKHGADPNVAGKYGQTPLLIAQQRHRADIVALLRQAGARK